MTDAPLLTRAQIRAVDASLIAAGLPGLLLMENAGRGAADEILRALPAPRCAVILVGPGNNGGDAMVVARHLRLSRPGCELRVLSLGDDAAMRGDAAVMRDALAAIGVRCARAPATDREQDAILADADLIIDGLFGTGLTRPLEGPALALVRAVRRRRGAFVAALDIPSGLDADTGAPLGARDDVIRAALTCTFAIAKPGLLTGLGAEVCGELREVALGTPIPLPHSEIRAWRSVYQPPAPRAATGHKGDAGHVLVVGGARGRVGAALLAARGAHRAGAGLVTIAAPAESALDTRVVESMTLSLPGDPSGLAAALDAALAAARAVVVGPGLGLGPWAEAVVAHVLARAAAPLVVDADALRVLAAGRAARVPPTAVLTPHPLELARMLGLDGIKPAERVNADRFGAAREAASRFGATVVLKGAGTVIATPDGHARVLPYADATLGVAGSGDVLAGAIGARLAEGELALDAAAQAAHAHALAGAAVRASRGAVRGALASEIADALSACLDVSDR